MSSVRNNKDKRIKIKTCTSIALYHRKQNKIKQTLLSFISDLRQHQFSEKAVH